jgi:outer membrane protein OmpA-like peptidoglycan-associated protein
LAAFKGCPDKDGDGITDLKDDCPDQPGPVEMNGCPDRDGDGLPDKQDRCPDKPGPIKNLGCPEMKLMLLNSSLSPLETVTMEDGKFNFNQCVEKAKALYKLYGEGSDTVRKVLVSCPELRVKYAYLEKDGLFHFPKEAEAVQLTAQEQEIVKKAFDNLEFATGKDIIKNESFASLDELAGLMQKHTGWKLKIEGHTDNQGKPAANLILSKKRAEAVKKYLVKKGVAVTRFDVKWYGQTKPLVPNDSEANRQKNRRVEMTIVE